MTFLILAAYLVVINLGTLMAFRRDKAASVEGADRVRESTLLTLAFVGGSIGAKLAQRRYRHKTRKEPFRSILNAIGGLHLLFAIALGTDFATEGRLSQDIVAVSASVHSALTEAQERPKRSLPTVHRGSF